MPENEGSGVLRYLYLCPFPGLGGTQEYTFTLARKMAAKHSVILAMPFDDLQKRQFEGPFHALGGKTLSVPPDLYEPLNGRSYIGRISAAWRLRRLIGERVLLRPSERLVVHTSMNPLAFAPLAIAAGKERVFVNVFHDFGNLQRRSISFLPNTIVLNLLSCRSCAFVVPSAYIADELVTKVAAVGRDRIHVIHTGIDPLPPRPKRRAEPPLKFGMIGRVAEAKAPDVWIAAIRMFLADGGHGEFHWFGQGPDLEACKREVKRAGIGHAAFFHGYVDDVRRVLDDLDVFVLSSRWEGGCPPFSVVEAMFRGLPCLLPTLPSIMEALGKENCALFYDAGNPASLAHGFAAALIDQERLTRLADAARRLALSNHSADCALAATTKIYDMMLRSGS